MNFKVQDVVVTGDVLITLTKSDLQDMADDKKAGIVIFRAKVRPWPSRASPQPCHRIDLNLCANRNPRLTHVMCCGLLVAHI